MDDCPVSDGYLLLSTLTMQDAYQLVAAFLVLSSLAWGCKIIAQLILNR